MFEGKSSYACPYPSSNQLMCCNASSPSYCNFLDQALSYQLMNGSSLLGCRISFWKCLKLADRRSLDPVPSSFWKDRSSVLLVSCTLVPRWLLTVFCTLLGQVSAFKSWCEIETSVPCFGTTLAYFTPCSFCRLSARCMRWVRAHDSVSCR